MVVLVEIHIKQVVLIHKSWYQIGLARLFLCIFHTKTVCVDRNWKSRIVVVVSFIKPSSTYRRGMLHSTTSAQKEQLGCNINLFKIHIIVPCSWQYNNVITITLCTVKLLYKTRFLSCRRKGTFIKVDCTVL